MLTNFIFNMVFKNVNFFWFIINREAIKHLGLIKNCQKVSKVINIWKYECMTYYLFQCSIM
jgi:hypothetical protein